MTSSLFDRHNATRTPSWVAGRGLVLAIVLIATVAFMTVGSAAAQTLPEPPQPPGPPIHVCPLNGIIVPNAAGLCVRPPIGCTGANIASAACMLPARVTTTSADRYGYCSVAGDTKPDGTPITAGTFLNLLLGQPDNDRHYAGATPAYFVRGIGATCTLSPTQAALASGATVRVNHTGHTGDPNEPDFYVLVG